MMRCSVHKMFCVIQHVNLTIQFLIDRQADLPLPSEALTQSIQVLILV